MSRVEYSITQFESNLKSNFIDSEEYPSDRRYSARIVANDPAQSSNLLSAIRSQLRDCDRFDFAVAFVSESGIQTLLQTLNLLRDQNVQGRFLTSTYQSFNSPQALRKLLEYPNIEVRVFQGNMHVKGYLFDKGDISTIIIGSSNLTQGALTCNKEWNVLFHSYGNGQMLKSTRSEFDQLWNAPDTVDLTQEWLAAYELHYRQARAAVSKSTTFRSLGAAASVQADLQPNEMQRHALEALGVLHERRETRALLVSATGTGKTYLSAFEVASMKPKRVLFVAHRTRILEASMRSFEKVLGDAYTYELYSAGSRCPEGSCVFAMVSTLCGHLDMFDPHDFDYIIIDEAHRTGAKSYLDVMSHFDPQFYLGMTATPCRTDGYDVYALFNHVIAYRITLHDALESQMLSPFHYFGIADLEIDDSVVDDPALFSKLTSAERVRHIAGKIEEYSVDKENRRGLIFCNRNDEAASLSESFNRLGYRTVSISGKTSDSDRDRAIECLEKGEIEYIFSVDIFNEGIDIPSLNQIIMLRRTESAIVFVQQLGRGLRLAEGKEYALILDFIGNYQKNFFVPIALSGDRTYVKDKLRRVVKEGSTIIPGCSTVSFDRISERRIFTAIDGGDFSSAKLIRDEYTALKQVLGRIPSLLDFDENQSIDPLIILNKYDSYHRFLTKYEKDYALEFSAFQEGLLRFVSKKMASGKRLEELLMLRMLCAEAEAGIQEFEGEYRRLSGRDVDPDSLRSAIAHLNGAFCKTELGLLVEEGVRSYARSHELGRALEDPVFKGQFTELLEFGMMRFARAYSQTYRSTSFALYQKYTYEEVCLLLNWKANVNAQNIGGYKYDADTNTFPVFINYEKAPTISDTIKYEDRFVSDDELIAISKGRRSLDSPEIRRLMAAGQTGMRTYLFVRKNKEDKGSKEFYFLGEMHPTGRFEAVTTIAGENAVEISYRLDTPVRADLFDYITSSID